jgi:hypothetical protein
MEATPLEQLGAVAVATYCTGEVTVVAAAGVVTLTLAPARAEKPQRVAMAQRRIFIRLPQLKDFWGNPSGADLLTGSKATKVSLSIYAIVTLAEDFW